jgi:hypothetical protein
VPYGRAAACLYRDNRRQLFDGKAKQRLSRGRSPEDYKGLVGLTARGLQPVCFGIGTSGGQAGDPNAAETRLAAISDLTLLAVDDSAIRLAESLALQLRLPDRASADALHIALAVVHGMNFLITWNCRHIANAQHRHLIEAICESLGYSVPMICTHEELFEDLPNVS